MALPSSYVQNFNKIPDYFKQIQDAQAPDQLTQKLLKDWGFASTNDRSFIPLLKSIGFLSTEGKPTQIYHQYRDHSKSARVLGQALRDSYSDIFLIKNMPSVSDEAAITGKFKSYFNGSDTTASRQARTFLALLEIADISETSAISDTGTDTLQEPMGADESMTTSASPQPIVQPKNFNNALGLHYNIQIHLPATKDVEVYNAIFKSLKEHLVE
jgi:hypothetical protein